MSIRLALARVNYSQLYSVYDGGKTFTERDILIPYQLLNLAAYVRPAGVEVRIFDGETDLLTQAALARQILDWHPDVVGFTATTPDSDMALEVCRLVKEDDPALVTVIGGIHATILPKDVAAHRGVDYVVTGDGEKPLADILQTVQRQGRPRPADPAAAGRILRGARMTLADLPQPAHDLLDYAAYQFSDPTRGQMRTASVMSSRGCPFDCSFCYHDRRVRYRPVEAFVAEIEHLYRVQGVRYFFIYDDVFLIQKERVLTILARLRALGLADAHFQCQSRANLTDPEILAALRDTGFVRLTLGIESGSEEMLQRCSKGITKADCVAACQRIHEFGLEPRASFIVGHPYETRATAEATIQFAKELELLHANFTVMTPYPGTMVHDMARRGQGLRFTKPEYATDWRVYRRWGQPIIETEALSADELEQLRERAVMEFYTQDKVFRYYEGLFNQGNRSRYFYRPLNFAWQRRYGRNIPFWGQLGEAHLVNPV